jgi:hypothetical protein
VDSDVAHVALHRSARSSGYKLLREGVDPRSLLRGDVCVVLARCVFVVLGVVFIVAPAFPFIVPKEMARVIFVVKR